MTGPKRDQAKPKGAGRAKAPETADARAPAPLKHERCTTAQPVERALEGGPPIPTELTGRASATGESLTQLFSNRTAEHLSDGFCGGSGDDPDTDIARGGREALLQTDSADELEDVGDAEEAEDVARTS